MSDAENGCENYIDKNNDKVPPPTISVGIELTKNLKRILELLEEKDKKGGDITCPKCKGNSYINLPPQSCYQHKLNCSCCDESGSITHNSKLCDRCHGSGTIKY